MIRDRYNNWKIIEYWKIIKNYSDYAISNLGRVKRIKDSKTSKKGKILKLDKNKNGYFYLKLYNREKHKTFRLACLVASHFLELPLIKKEVNHKDGDKSNNTVCNLEYVTHKENQRHAYRLGLMKGRKGENHHNTKLKDKDILEIRKEYKKGKVTQLKLSDKYGISSSEISMICTKRIWKHVND